MSATEIELLCQPIGDCKLVELSGHEAMDSLSSWLVRVCVAEHVGASTALHADALLVFRDPLEGTERRVRLLVTEAAVELGRGRDRVLG